MTEATLQLPWARSSARVAREFVRGALLERTWDMSSIDDAILLTSELVANAVLHGEPVLDGNIQLRLRHGPNRLCVEVVDGSNTWPVIRPVAEGGRGLRLVEVIAARWGTIPDGAGKVVWFELDKPTSRLT